MNASQWWIYDLVVLAIGILCVWNGFSNGIYRALGSFLIGVVSFLLASVIATPAAEMTYDMFFQQQCQHTVSENLQKVDMTSQLRNLLAQNGISLPYSDEEIAQMIQDANEDGGTADQIAGYLGMDADSLKTKLGTAVIDAVNAQGDILPSWASTAMAQATTADAQNAVTEAAASFFAEDYDAAAKSLEQAFVRPVVVTFLSALIFSVSAFLISLLLRVVILALPVRRDSLWNRLLGGVLGLAKAGVYLCLMVLLVKCISSMQNGAYPFFSEETVNRTYIFRTLYAVFASVR
jgi:uncharacterized membrane protein required for colicin V production